MRRVRRWQYGHIASWKCAHVTVIEDGGRWMVERTGQTVSETRVVEDEAAAYELAESLTSGEEWFEVPAVYDDQHRPVDPGPWVSIGGQWRRPG